MDREKLNSDVCGDEAILSGFLDGELDPKRTRLIRERLEGGDLALARQLDELRQVKVELKALFNASLFGGDISVQDEASNFSGAINIWPKIAAEVERISEERVSKIDFLRSSLIFEFCHSLHRRLTGAFQPKPSFGFVFGAVTAILLVFSPMFLRSVKENSNGMSYVKSVPGPAEGESISYLSLPNHLVQLNPREANIQDVDSTKRQRLTNSQGENHFQLPLSFHDKPIQVAARKLRVRGLRLDVPPNMELVAANPDIGKSFYADAFKINWLQSDRPLRIFSAPKSDNPPVLWLVSNGR